MAMKNGYMVLDPVETIPGDLQNHFAEDVRNGLSAERKSLPSKYIYDDAGSSLFCRIMDLPEYYLTDCETEILRNNAGYIANAIGNGGLNLVELGAGDGKKTKIILHGLLKEYDDVTYVPIDISEGAIHLLLAELESEYPLLKVKGLVTDYFAGLRWLSDSDMSRNVVLFLGSNIGNFTPEERTMFLKSLHASMNTGDYLFTGFDMVKDIDILERAYNDTEGITARFNMNILERINRELDGNFDTEQFSYKSHWHPGEGAIKSFLVSRIKQEVYIDALSMTCNFEAGEAVHTESSHKFTEKQILGLAESTGFTVENVLYDSRRYFADCLWTA